MILAETQNLVHFFQPPTPLIQRQLKETDQNKDDDAPNIFCCSIFACTDALFLRAQQLFLQHGLCMRKYQINGINIFVILFLGFLDFCLDEFHKNRGRFMTFI